MRLLLSLAWLAFVLIKQPNLNQRANAASIQSLPTSRLDRQQPQYFWPNLAQPQPQQVVPTLQSCRPALDSLRQEMNQASSGQPSSGLLLRAWLESTFEPVRHMMHTTLTRLASNGDVLQWQNCRQVTSPPPDAVDNRRQVTVTSQTAVPTLYANSDRDNIFAVAPSQAPPAEFWPPSLDTRDDPAMMNRVGFEET